MSDYDSPVLAGWGEASCWDYRRLYSTTLWTRVSKIVVARDPLCACGRPSTTADHIVSARELAKRGELHRFFDLDNLRGSCRSCNSRRGALEENARRRGRPRKARARRWRSAEEMAEAWAVQERAYWARLEAERLEAQRPSPPPRRTPRIY
jgi:hypothetical protein